MLSTKKEIHFNKPPIDACPCLRKCVGDKKEAWQVSVSANVGEEAAAHCDLCNESFLDYKSKLTEVQSLPADKNQFIHSAVWYSTIWHKETKRE